MYIDHTLYICIRAYYVYRRYYAYRPYNVYKYKTRVGHAGCLLAAGKCVLNLPCPAVRMPWPAIVFVFGVYERAREFVCVWLCVGVCVLLDVWCGVCVCVCVRACASLSLSLLYANASTCILVSRTTHMRAHTHAQTHIPVLRFEYSWGGVWLFRDLILAHTHSAHHRRESLCAALSSWYQRAEDLKFWKSQRLAIFLYYSAIFLFKALLCFVSSMVALHWKYRRASQTFFEIVCTKLLAVSSLA